MAPFDECCLLLPSATLEDFPATASDSDACNLLAAWTVLWHPALLAQTQQLPTWYRADSPPDSDGPRVIVVPSLSQDQLPKGFQLKCQQNPDCAWIQADTRSDMEQQLELPPLPELTGEARIISVQDFYAAGFASLQVQVMTRRLRYTSNLDELHVQNRLVEAAKCFVDGNGQGAIDALHDVFDCLAEERDHYFASDPHLVDLTLLTPQTLESVQWQPNDPHSKSDEGPKPTPGNLLIDHAVATALQSPEKASVAQVLQQAISAGDFGWAGGEPDPNIAWDTLSISEAESALARGMDHASAAIGSRPTVYSRFSGFTPSDLTPTLVRLGYDGMIPIDFAAGTGFGEEAKLIREYGASEIHALTAKPIDAASDASFLTLGSKLGESIDSGEIATALLAHWPERTCQSFEDLRRVASWSLVLGKFWRIDDYFKDGEHPYHHGSSAAISAQASELLDNLVTQNSVDPISTLAGTIQESVINETKDRLRQINALVSNRSPEANDRGTLKELAERFVECTGAEIATQSGNAYVVVNPHQTGVRESVTLTGMPPAKAEHVYASSSESDGQSSALVDVPAYGFASVQCGKEPAKKRGLFQRLVGGSKEIAESNELLRNEFMEVAISAESGAIMGVYSGSGRGNRFSMRLIRVSEESDYGVMQAQSVKVKKSSTSEAVIEVIGKLVDEKSGANYCDFELEYRLEQGSRFLKVDGTTSPSKPSHGTPWQNYFALRSAVANEAAIARVMVRDKIHRGRGRRLVSPLGIIIDESERQTLVASKGLAFHRRASDRFLDTLVHCQGESNNSVSIVYGFDVPNPLAACRSITAGGGIQIPVAASTKLTPRGWILHSSPSELTINSLDVFQRRDGRLAAHLRVVQTRAKSGNASLRFLRDVEFATILDLSDPEAREMPLPDAESESTHAVQCNGDQVKVPVTGHQVLDLLVVFADA